MRSAAALLPKGEAPRVQWAAIRRASCPLLIEPRRLGPLEQPARSLAHLAPFQRLGEGRVEQAVAALGELPEVLRRDIKSLASRFAALMSVKAVRIRLEGVSTNACRKIHSDRTGVRLITTYCGPGTEYVPDGAPADEARLIAIPTGSIALFKAAISTPITRSVCTVRRRPRTWELSAWCWSSTRRLIRPGCC